MTVDGLQSLADSLLTLVLVHGYPILFVVVLVGSFGVPTPVPISLIVVAAGSFAADDEFALPAVITVTAVAAVAGDCTSFLVSRWVGEAAIVRYGARLGLNARRLDGARRRMGAWTGAAVFLTRWLVTPLATPTNVVSAVSGYPLRRFIVLSAAGETVWAGAYAGTGYVFGASWESVAQAIGDGAALAAGLALVLIALAAARRLARQTAAGRSPARPRGVLPT